MATGTVVAGTITGNQLVLDYLSRTINEIIGFRNTSVSPQRQNLLNTLRQAYLEAAACNLEPCDGSASHRAVAKCLLTIPSGKALADAVAEADLSGMDVEAMPDPGWLEGLFDYVSSRRVNFHVHTNPTDALHPIAIPADQPVRIALVGHWGGSSPSAHAMADVINAQRPHYTIHLGDVYYSGRRERQTQKLVESWPRGSIGSFALNSTHDMYSGGEDYFKVALWSGTFALQNNLSYFALHNPRWLIIGLDTAYFAYNYSLLYDEGTLNDPQDHNGGSTQLKWLRELLLTHPAKRVIILTHHDGLSIDPVAHKLRPRPLWTQVTSELRGRREWWWYWSRIHAAIAYRRVTLPDGTAVTARCVGYGGVSYKPAFCELRSVSGAKIAIEWTEKETASSNGSCRTHGGFAMLTIDDQGIKEQFYDGTGRVRWACAR